MALEDILATIRTEAEETASDLLAAARAEADQLLERAREEASREERRLAGSLDDRTRQERSRVLSRARLDAARARDLAREEVYQSARERVIRRLEQVRTSPDYEGILAALLEEAIAAMPAIDEVRVDPRDVESMERIVADRGLDVAVVPEETPLGGVLAVADRRAVDNTLATRLERADEHLRYIAGELIPTLRGGVG